MRLYNLFTYVLSFILLAASPSVPKNEETPIQHIDFEAEYDAYEIKANIQHIEAKEFVITVNVR